MILKLFNFETKSISSASLILSLSYLASALMGLMRDRLLAGVFGAGNELDIYYTAFTIPDFIALLLIFGAISAAVIPIFSSYLLKSKEEAFAYLSAFLNIFLGFLIIISIILIIFAPFLIKIIAPGFPPEKQAMAVLLMRIMFLSPIILGISNIISGVLQVFHRFLVTALCPLLYNAGIIIGIIFFVPRFGLVGLAFGVILGGILHLLVQIPSLISSGFRYKLNFNFRDPGIIKTIHLMVPRSLGLAAGQLNTIAITAIGSTLTAGSIAVFNLANNLSSMMVTAMAVSVSTAAFPSMSIEFLKNNGKKFFEKFSNIIRQIFFLTIPATFLVLLLRAQIVRVVLGAGKFDWVDTKLTTACLGLLAVNIVAQSLILFISKSFYAAHNTKIPAILSGVTVAFNIIFSLVLVRMLQSSENFSFFMQETLRLTGVNNIAVAGLAMAFSITAVLESIALFYYFYKKFPKIHIKEIYDSLYITLLSTFVMVFITFFARQLLGIVLDLQIFWGVFLQLFISTIVAILSYISASYWLDSSELKVFFQSFINKFIVG